MHYGLSIFPTEYSMQPAELAQAAEERGFESIWFPEHTHIPVSRETPWPGGAPLPQDGTIEVGDAPGLGLELDNAKVEALTALHDGRQA